MVTLPTSMDQCVYFTRRAVDNGKIVAWVYRKECPSCKKDTMGKPVVKGKVKVRATEYVCPSCGHTEQKKAHEESLTLETQYTCPHCSHSGEASIPYKRVTFQGIPSYVFRCSSCDKKIGITKKMKTKKKK